MKCLYIVMFWVKDRENTQDYHSLINYSITGNKQKNVKVSA